MKNNQLLINAVESGFSPRVQSLSASKITFMNSNNSAVPGTLSDFMISSPIVIDSIPDSNKDFLIKSL